MYYLEQYFEFLSKFPGIIGLAIGISYVAVAFISLGYKKAPYHTQESFEEIVKRAVHNNKIYGLINVVMILNKLLWTSLFWGFLYTIAGSNTFTAIANSAWLFAFFAFLLYKINPRNWFLNGILDILKSVTLSTSFIGLINLFF